METLNGLLVSIKAAIPLFFELAKVNNSTYHKDAYEDALEEVEDSHVGVARAKTRFEKANNAKLAFEEAKADLEKAKDKWLGLEKSITYGPTQPNFEKIKAEAKTARERFDDMLIKAEAAEAAYDEYDFERAEYKVEESMVDLKNAERRLARETTRFEAEEARVSARIILLDKLIKNFS